MIHLLENVSQKWRVDHNFDSTNRHKWLLEDDHHQLQFGHNRDVQGGGPKWNYPGPGRNSVGPCATSVRHESKSEEGGGSRPAGPRNVNALDEWHGHKVPISQLTCRIDWRLLWLPMTDTHKNCCLTSVTWPGSTQLTNEQSCYWQSGAVVMANDGRRRCHSPAAAILGGRTCNNDTSLKLPVGRSSTAEVTRKGQ